MSSLRKHAFLEGFYGLLEKVAQQPVAPARGQQSAPTSPTGVQTPKVDPDALRVQQEASRILAPSSQPPQPAQPLQQQVQDLLSQKAEGLDNDAPLQMSNESARSVLAGPSASQTTSSFVAPSSGPPSSAYQDGQRLFTFQPSYGQQGNSAENFTHVGLKPEYEPPKPSVLDSIGAASAGSSQGASLGAAARLQLTSNLRALQARAMLGYTKQQPSGGAS